MSPLSFKPRPLAAAITLLVAAAGIAAIPAIAGPVVVTGTGTGKNDGAVGPDAKTVLSTGPASYIITFAEPALAQYDGSKPTLDAIPRTTSKNGRSAIDVKSAQAKAYVDALQIAQDKHIDAITTALGLAQGTLPVRFKMQYALNAVVATLTGAQARQVAQVAGVASVMRDGKHAPATDIGPGFIGASNLWWGQTAGQDTIFLNGFEQSTGFRGDGIVVGDIDTGYNSKSPSFSATDASGYTITNPLGHGHYLGQCNLPGISLAGCNDKVIGVYDLVSTAAPYSAEDTQGHGSHTASTAAGNSRQANYHGYVAQLSGVAPHANLEIFYVCSPDPNVLCQDSSVVSAVDHAIQDGVVNVLNFSISGGTDPWNGAVAQAFLSANNAGIFVAAAGGNTSTSVPAAIPGTVNHWEPWVATVAASTHTGGPIGTLFSATGPGTPPANATNIPLSEAQNDTPLTAPLGASTPFKLSPNFHNNDTSGTDGCNSAPYPTGTFTGAIALISRGTCAYGEKVGNAVAAGAVAVVISDNRPEAAISITLGSPVRPIPAYSILQSDGTNLKNFLAANSNAGTATIPYPPSRLPQQPDVLAGFSLLGPGNSGMIKPDIEAPGVHILASVANDGTANGPNLVDLYDGTSMATPHTTGSGALLMGLHPDWTPSEIKSALMLTAKESDVTKPDAITPADFYDRGSGRIQVDIASKSGLVMNETTQNYKLANPATGGNPSKLNIASMENLNCYTATANTCRFIRSFTGTGSQSVNWTATVTGDLAGDVTISAGSTFTSLPGGSSSVQLDIDSSSFIDPTSGVSDGSAHFGELVLTPDDGSPVLHLPISAAIPAPIIDVQTVANLKLNGAPSVNGNLPIANHGGPTLTFAQDTTSTDSGYFVLANYASQGNNGYYSTRFTDIGNVGFYASQQFTVGGASAVNLSTIGAYGFGVGAALSTYPAATPLHVRIYADASGKPAGNPEAAAPAPVWGEDTTLSGGDAVVFGGNNIAVFPSTATNLAPGKYWVTVYPDLKCNPDQTGNCTTGWAWFLTNDTTAPVGQSIFPSGSAPGNQWTAFAENVGLATYLDSAQDCSSIPWLAMTPNSGSVGGLSSTTTTLTATAASMPATSVTSYLCIASNTGDQNTPALIQVNATK